MSGTLPINLATLDKGVLKLINVFVAKLNAPVNPAVVYLGINNDTQA